MRKAVIRIELDDRVSTKLEEIRKKFQSFDASQQIQKTTKATEKLKKAWHGVVEEVISLKSILITIANTSILAMAIKEGAKFVDTLDRAKYQIAGSIILTGELYKNGKKITDETEKWNVALKIATKTIKEIQQYNLKTVATFDEILEQFSQIVPYVTSVGGNLEQAVKFAYLMVNAVKLLGLQTYQVVSETRSLLTGENLVHSQIAQILGITREQIEAWRKQGILLDEIIKRLYIYEKVGQNLATTLSGAFSNLRDAIQYITGLSFEPVIRYTIDVINNLQSKLVTVKDNVLEINQNIVNQFKKVSYAILVVIENIKELKDKLLDIFKDNPAIVKFAELYGKMLLVTAGVMALVQSLRLLVGVFKIVGNRLTIAITLFGLLYEAVKNPELALNSFKEAFSKFGQAVNSILVKIVDKMIKFFEGFGILGKKFADKLKGLKAELQENIEWWNIEEQKYKKSMIEFLDKTINDYSDLFKKAMKKLGLKTELPEDVFNKYFKSKIDVDVNVNAKFKPSKQKNIDKKELERLKNEKIDIIIDIFDNEKLELGKQYADQIEKITKLYKEGIINQKEKDFLISKAYMKFMKDYNSLLVEEKEKQLQQEKIGLEFQYETVKTTSAKLQILNKLIEVEKQYVSLLKESTSEYYQHKKKLIELQKEYEKLYKQQHGTFIEGIQDKVKQLKNTMTNLYTEGQKFAETIKNAFQDTLSSGIFDLFMGKLKSLKDYIRMFTAEVSRYIAQLLAKIMVNKAIETISNKFNFGGQIPERKISGGIVGRANTGLFTSGLYGVDNIPVLAQKGEYIVRKEAVNRYGIDFLDKINSLRWKPESRSFVNNVVKSVNQSNIVRNENKNVNITMEIYTLDPITFEQYVRETGIIQRLVNEDLSDGGDIYNQIRRSLK